MGNDLIEKYKIQISMYIKEMFFYFPDIKAVDLIVKRIDKIDNKSYIYSMISDSDNYKYQLYLVPYISEELIKNQFNIVFDKNISFLKKIENINDINNLTIIDWKELEDYFDNNNLNKHIYINSIKNKQYNYTTFFNDFLNFQIFKDKYFLEQLFSENFNDKISYSFINGNEDSINIFLGQKAKSILNKLELLENLEIDKNFNHKKFKI